MTELIMAAPRKARKTTTAAKGTFGGKKKKKKPLTDQEEFKEALKDFQRYDPDSESTEYALAKGRLYEAQEAVAAWWK